MKNTILCSSFLTVLGTLALTSSVKAINFLPSELSAGDQYRLVFVTSSKTNAVSTDINFYNSFVQNAADVSGLTSDIFNAGLCDGSCEWKVIGSTSAVDAIVNTSTTGTGVPIYLVETLDIVANNYPDLWDGNIDVAINHNENGNLYDDSPWRVWTGTDSNGLKINTLELGGTASGGNTITGSVLFDSAAWINVGIGGATSHETVFYPLYGISEVLTVESETTPESSNILSLLALGGIALSTFKKRRG